jgi:hypothetical protein
MAIDIAEESRSHELTEAILAVALDSEEDPHIRSQAAHGVLVLGDLEQRVRLRGLLDASELEDRDDELKGVALQALWPRDLSASELFGKYLTLPKRSNYFGAYAYFLSRLPESLAREHLVPALSWVSRRAPDHNSDHRFSELASAVMRQAWTAIDDPAIRKSFCEAALHRINQYDPVIAEGRGVSKPEAAIQADTYRRRLLLGGLVRLVGAIPEGDRRVLTYRLAELAEASDFGWLAEQHHDSRDPQAAAVWLAIVERVFDPQHRNQADLLLVAAGRDPVLRSRMMVWLDPVALGSPQAAQMRADYEKGQREQQPGPQEESKHPPSDVMCRELIAKAKAGDLDAWWRLNLVMTLRPGSDYFPPNADFEADITKLPGWQSLGEDDRRDCFDVAWHYIHAADPATDEWLGTSTFHRPAAAGYRAIRLFYKADPSRLDRLQPGVWAKWAPAILTFPESPGVGDETPVLDIVSKAYRGAPEAVIKTLITLIETENRKQGTVFITRKFEKAWDQRLAGAVLQKVADPELSGRNVQILLTDVFRLVPDAALKVALGLVDERESSPALGARAQFAAVASIEGALAAAWPRLWPLFQADPSFGSIVLETLASNWDLSSAPRPLAELPEQDLAELYVWLRRLAPGERKARFGFVAPHESIIDLRDYVLEALKRRGSEAAVREIKQITEAFPELPWLRYVLLEAEETRLRESWAGLDLEDLNKLASDRDACLVHDGTDLLDAVLASLGRLEASLRGETPAIWGLWNEKPNRPKDESRLSDHVKTHLKQDLGARGIVANREVELRPSDQSDLRVDAIRRRPLQDGYDQLSVLVEVKGCWNPELRSGMQAQLRDRYLCNSRCRYGVYVVGWFLCPGWDESDYRKKGCPKWSLEEAREFFMKQAHVLSTDGFLIRSCVLDLTLS